MTDRPNYKIYPVTKEPIKICRFCRRENSESEISELCGPLYGPIRINKNDIYVHELCAKWTPEIYQDDNNKFVGLKEAILRCDACRCTHCDTRGGGLGCIIESCKNSYHYLCAETINCIKWDWTIYCPDHLKDAPKEALEQEIEIDEEEEKEESII